MNFSDSQKKIFKKNLAAIKGNELEKKFKLIKKPKEFALHFGADSLDINIQSLKNKEFIYENPLQELTDKVALYQNKYILYPMLFFYGFGNGLLYKVLLQNEQLKFLIVFEESAELLWLVLHLVDFHKELKDGRLVIVKKDSMDFFEFFLRQNFVYCYSKTYFLEPLCLYYEKHFSDEMVQINKALTQIIFHASLEKGNSSIDALQGIENRVLNFAAQLTHPDGVELVSKRAGAGQSAVCVATGPSLSKQLPLLKAVQDRVTIFCADSAYPILMRNDIVPDYVFMLERTDFTAEFFNHDFKGRDKDTLFMLCDLVHPNAVKYLEKYKRKYIMFKRNLEHTYINLTRYFVLEGLSVSHNALDLAAMLSYKNIILIGQDLAYAKDGASHAKNYQHDEFYESDMSNKEETTAYGGKGVVQTHFMWLHFKKVMEQNIKSYSHCKVYNCTEGGAQIENAKEMPFKKAIEKFIQNEPLKSLAPLEARPKAKQDEALLGVYAKLKKQIIKCEDFIQEYNDDFKAIQSTFEAVASMEAQSYEENKPYFEECDRIIDKVKKQIEEKKTNIYIYEVLEPIINQFEMAMSQIYTYNPQNEQEKNVKMFAWIGNHLEWLKQLIIQISNQKTILENSLNPLQDALKKAGKDIEAKMKMIDTKDKKCLMFA